MISKEDIDHLAVLARIDLSETEKKRFFKDLEEVLGYVEKLREVETEHVEPLANAVGSYNVMREDEPPQGYKGTPEGVHVKVRSVWG